MDVWTWCGHDGGQAVFLRVLFDDGFGDFSFYDSSGLAHGIHAL